VVSSFSFSKLDGLQKLLLIVGCIISFLLLAPYSGLVPFNSYLSQRPSRFDTLTYSDDKTHESGSDRRQTLDDVFSSSEESFDIDTSQDRLKNEESEATTAGTEIGEIDYLEKPVETEVNDREKRIPKSRSPKRSFSDIEALLSE
jgi:hypothetical protein